MKIRDVKLRFQCECVHLCTSLVGRTNGARSICKSHFTAIEIETVKETNINRMKKRENCESALCAFFVDLPAIEHFSTLPKDKL